MAKFEALNDEALEAVNGGASVNAADNTPAWQRPHWQPDEYPMGSTFEAYGYLWYRIKPGDILGRIAQTYGTTSAQLQALNAATIKDITDNPYNIEFSEVEAAQLPNVLQDVDYAIINSNYAIAADINPVKDALAIEGSSSAYGNILAVKEGNENSDKIKALKAALESKQVADFIADTYGGSVVSVVENPGDGFDSGVDYAALSGQTITVAASPAPHAEILKIAKDILAEKNITLEIIEYTDYVQPNNVVESGEVDANYFQHVPYLDDFNAENGTHIVSVSTVHVEPMGLYGGQQTSLDALKK